MKKLLVLLALLLVVSASRSAHADTFTFSFSSATYSGSGTLFAQLQPANTAQPTTGAQAQPPNSQYLITTASGSVNTGSGGTQSISSVIPPDPSSQHFEDNDNLLFYPGTNGFFDLNGVSFLLADGSMLNLFYDSNSGYGTYYMHVNGSLHEEDATVSVLAVPTIPPVAATPEPSSLVLLGTGVLGVAGAMRRRFIS